MGRNIWQSENPVAMIKAVRSIVHGNSNVDQAFKLYKKLSSEKKQNESKKSTPKKSTPKKSNKPNTKK
jgi:putative autoinducer-2 (AI-2) aldolase